MNIDLARLRQHLADKGIAEAAVGGPVVQDTTKARFLVFHDTSSPEISNSSFPANMNEKEWSGNKLSNWVASQTPTHVFINRVGESATKNNFSVTVSGTKYEGGRDFPPGNARQEARNKRRGLFLHIELVQPRRRSNPNSSFFDVAPSPGFPAPQLERLALLYVVAMYSLWPLAIAGISLFGGCDYSGWPDDPQNFDLDGWLNSLNALLTDLGVT